MKEIHAHLNNALTNIGALEGRGDDAHNQNIASAKRHIEDALTMLDKPAPKAKKATKQK